MNTYAFQALEESGEPIGDESFHELKTVISEETIRDQARHIAMGVAKDWPDDRPWNGWSIEVFSKIGDAPRERQVITFEELMA